MVSRNTDQTGGSVVRRLRRALLGDSFGNAVGAITIGVFLTLCVTVVEFSLVQPSIPNASYRWSVSGIVSVSFLACLVVIAAAYSYRSGGLVDCCAVLLVPLFISHLTFISVAPTTGDPVPIWQWSFGQYFIENIRAATYGAVLWGSGLGVVGFLLGTMSRAVGRGGMSGSRTDQSG